jgi:hypothetical protein
MVISLLPTIKDICVDINGDLGDDKFRYTLATIKYNLILCNNVVTHVKHPNYVFEVISNCLSDDGFVNITAPIQYPYCADPIDSKYRPNRTNIERSISIL